MGSENLMFRGICLSLVACLMPLLGGCSAPSLLITPVSGSRKLVETELSRDSFFTFDKIALIDVSGMILNAHSPQLMGKGEHSVSRLAEQLEKARLDSAVKAVILRINSPGGTVVASELMHDEITHFKESGKPIIAVMMDVAASGGYYIACACDEIVAQPSTVTGSIGVIMQMVDFSGTMNLIGLKSTAITSGEFKASGSPFRELLPKERELFQGIVDEMYERFVGVVVAGRKNLDEAAVRRLADGRIYTAGQALEVGLIDRIANLRESIVIAKALSHTDRVRLVTYSRPAAFRPNFYARTGGIVPPSVNLINIDVASLIAGSAPQFLYLWSPGVR